MTNNQNSNNQTNPFGYSVIGDWNLFGYCNLVIGYSLEQFS